ncbi:hypothetical protein SNEBB_003673 [Seison nebaliae]|nr:hypothetical protein SNEBB_003673 [Seison nebaliae]
MSTEELRRDTNIIQSDSTTPVPFQPSHNRSIIKSPYSSTSRRRRAIDTTTTSLHEHSKRARLFPLDTTQKLIRKNHQMERSNSINDDIVSISDEKEQIDHVEGSNELMDDGEHTTNKTTNNETNSLSNNTNNNNNNNGNGTMNNNGREESGDMSDDDDEEENDDGKKNRNNSITNDEECPVEICCNCRCSPAACLTKEREQKLWETSNNLETFYKSEMVKNQNDEIGNSKMNKSIGNDQSMSEQIPLTNLEKKENIRQQLERVLQLAKIYDVNLTDGKSNLDSETELSVDLPISDFDFNAQYKGTSNQENERINMKTSDILRIILQYLRHKGLDRSSDILMRESGMELEQPVELKLRRQILNGEWNNAIGTLALIECCNETIMNGNNILSNTLDENNERLMNYGKMRYFILEQKYLEALDMGLHHEAFRCLHDEIRPLDELIQLNHDVIGSFPDISLRYDNYIVTLNKDKSSSSSILSSEDSMEDEKEIRENKNNEKKINQKCNGGIPLRRINQLASFLFCSGSKELRRIANWYGTGSKSRSLLLEALQRLLPSSVMLPPHRLQTLLSQSLTQQRQHCIQQICSHSVSSLGLLVEHECKSNSVLMSQSQVLTDADTEILFCAFANKSNYLATGCKHGKLRIYKLNTETVTFSLYHTFQDDLMTEVCHISWSPDDRYIVTCDNDGTAYCWIWDFIELRLQRRFHVSDEDSLIVSAFTPIQPYRFAVGGKKGKFYLVDTNGRSLHEGFGIRIQYLGTLSQYDVIIADTLKRVRMYNFISQEYIQLFTEDNDIISFALTPDRKRILVSIASQGLNLWDIESRTLMRRFRGVEQRVYSIYASFGGASNSLIASGSESNDVCVWKHESEECIGRLPGHTGIVNCVSWSHCPSNCNGRIDMIASVSDDKTTRIWLPTCIIQKLHRSNYLATNDKNKKNNNNNDNGKENNRSTNSSTQTSNNSSSSSGTTGTTGTSTTTTNTTTSNTTSASDAPPNNRRGHYIRHQHPDEFLSRQHGNYYVSSGRPSAREYRAIRLTSPYGPIHQMSGRHRQYDSYRMTQEYSGSPVVSRREPSQLSRRRVFLQQLRSNASNRSRRLSNLRLPYEENVPRPHQPIYVRESQIENRNGTELRDLSSYPEEYYRRQAQYMHQPPPRRELFTEEQLRAIPQEVEQFLAETGYRPQGDRRSSIGSAPPEEPQLTDNVETSQTTPSQEPLDASISDDSNNTFGLLFRPRLRYMSDIERMHFHQQSTYETMRSSFHQPLIESDHTSSLNYQPDFTDRSTQSDINVNHRTRHSSLPSNITSQTIQSSINQLNGSTNLSSSTISPQFLGNSSETVPLTPSTTGSSENRPPMKRSDRFSDSCIGQATVVSNQLTPFAGGNVPSPNQEIFS